MPPAGRGRFQNWWYHRLIRMGEEALQGETLFFSMVRSIFACDTACRKKFSFPLQVTSPISGKSCCCGCRPVERKRRSLLLPGRPVPTIGIIKLGFSVRLFSAWPRSKLAGSPVWDVSRQSPLTRKIEPSRFIESRLTSTDVKDERRRPLSSVHSSLSPLDPDDYTNRRSSLADAPTLGH